MILKSTIKCLECGFEKEETIPNDYCLIFYTCTSCDTLLERKPGTCCIFCSYGDVKCLSKQNELLNQHHTKTYKKMKEYLE